MVVVCLYEEYQFLLDDRNISEKRRISTEFYKRLKGNFSPDFSDFFLKKAYETDNYYYEILQAIYLLVVKRSDVSLDIDYESI
ncbi:hypothetical protein EGW35_07210 [Enterococcus durans]|nr:hypothetical protein EGW35_07210 [Enterococcus durans]